MNQETTRGGVELPLEECIVVLVGSLSAAEETAPPLLSSILRERERERERERDSVGDTEPGTREPILLLE